MFDEESPLLRIPKQPLIIGDAGSRLAVEKNDNSSEVDSASLKQKRKTSATKRTRISDAIQQDILATSDDK